MITNSGQITDEKLIIKHEGNSFTLPLTIVDSGVLGKTFVFTAGIHGDEPGGVAIVEKIKKYFKQNRLKRGKVILFPKLNPLGLEKNIRNFPQSDEDLNRCFTNNPQTVGEQIIYKVIEKILEFKPDQIIDIHNDWKNSCAYTILDNPVFIEKNIFVKCLDMAKAIDFPIVEDNTIMENSLSGYFAKKGIPTLTLEIGGDKIIYKKFISLGRNTLLYLLYKEEMIAFNFLAWLLKFKSPQIVSGKTLSYVDISNPIEKKDVRKIVYYAKPKKIVKQGSLLCTVQDKKKNKYKVFSPVHGIVLGHNEKILEFPEGELYALGNIG